MRFVTPTYPGDYERTRTLRSSLERFNPDDEHLLVVADADLPSARRAFGTDAAILAHSEVLPGRSPELHRLPAPARRRLKLGWWLQQLAKLNVGRALALDSWICLDSDTFLVDTIRPADCYAPDGRPFLLELLDHPVGGHVERFNRRAARILDLPADAASVARVYTAMCVPISAVVCDQLLTWLEDHHRGPWWLTMARLGGTEYALYGQFARYHNQLRDVVVRHDPLSVDVYHPRPCGELVERIRQGRDAGRRLAMVHSHLDYSPEAVRRLAQAVWAA